MDSPHDPLSAAPQPFSVADFEAIWKQAVDATRSLREAERKSEEWARRCSCPDFCYYHTRLK